MLKRSSVIAVALASVSWLAVSAGSASAETLQEALALAYQTNPTLLAQRANQRALDESIPQARASYRPTVEVGIGASYTRTDVKGTPVTDVDNASLEVSLSQTVYSGGRIGHAVSAAEANVLAGRENLRSVEQQVLASVIEAYVGVQRDMQILQIRQDNLAVLRRQLDESNARFEVGEITRTDVAQSESRLASSEADLANAQAQLSVSRAAYAAVVGQAPTNLVTPPELPGVPTDFEQALDVGLVENPSIVAADYTLQAAEARVAAARSAYLPQAGLTASYGGSGDLSDFDLADRSSLTVGAQISVPLFTGGLNASRVAQALETANAAKIAIDGERRGVLQDVSSAYARVVSTKATVTAGNEAVRAATVAAEGVRQEAQVGLRTTLDVLNQELELRSAQVQLVSAVASAYIAQSSLLAAMGRLEGPNLVPSLEAYDAAANTDAVRGRGALPWDGVLETIDRIAAPPVTPTPQGVQAPIDTQLQSDIVKTAPQS
ncbi:TolC family outer membrane protein [Brevundimonas goettingensis]|uniref:TolC family outer membrane protein n=1 Tax=Brevundimonas goettingensis TaxID=2774190 RepID=A0A975C1A4_9CAUL|nr:TolC family outer membrane protein [Brevundimonas goettingensis]QTC92043.1 TolC family outer membrane protein [Brevundimonas goettingensis]